MHDAAPIRARQSLYPAIRTRLLTFKNITALVKVGIGRIHLTHCATSMMSENFALSAPSGGSNVVKRDKQSPRPFLEFVQSTAPLCRPVSSDKISLNQLQALDQRAGHQGQNERISESLSHEQPERCLQHRPPMPGTPRLIIESPSSESDSMIRDSLRLPMDDSSDECSSYYSDSCAIEREPRKAEDEQSGLPMWGRVTQTFKIVNKAQQYSNASSYGSHLTLRRLSRVDPGGNFNLRQSTDIGCSEYDGDDESTSETKGQLVGSVGVRTGTRNV